MRAYISLFLALLLLFGSIAVTASAGETDTSDPPASSTATEPSATEPSATDKPEAPSTQPSDPTVTEPQPSTQPSQPCSHTYGDWGRDEVSHWQTCTACGHRESSGHSWAADTIAVDPTCGEAGGVCKICTVCQGVLVIQLIEPTGNHTYTNACDTTCNGCGAERTIEHTFGKSWKYSYKGHWHYCTICGAEDELKAHYPGPAATEEKDQICLTCGYVMTEKKEHTHKWDSGWIIDETGHWHSCMTCEKRDAFAAHSYDNDCDEEYEDCGYLRLPLHSYGDTWNQTDLTHSNVCTLCGAVSPEEEHTPDAAGTKCSICGYAMAAEEELHEHEFAADTWGFDEAGHWNVCMCGERSNAETHSWDEGREKGKQITYTCDICSAERTEEAPENGFPWLLVALGGGALICLCGIVICILLIRKDREMYE